MTAFYQISLPGSSTTGSLSAFVICINGRELSDARCFEFVLRSGGHDVHEIDGDEKVNIVVKGLLFRGISNCAFAIVGGARDMNPHYGRHIMKCPSG